MGFNSTIISKKKRCKTCGNKDYIFSHGECKQCSTISSTKKRMAEFEDKEESESLQNLVEDLDAIFSIYIRTKYADKNGIVECYTCGNKNHYKEVDCGHFIPRANMATRFEVSNCKPQCKTCNQYKDGNIEAYEKHLEQDRKGTVEYLRELGRTTYKYSIDELKGMIAEYRHKVQILKNKFQ